MTERFPTRRSHAALAILATSLAVAGCTEAAPAPTHAPVTMERCFDTPQPGHTDKKTGPYDQPNAITLHYSPAKGAIREMPASKPAIMQKLKAGNVKVMSGPSVTGSAFVTEAHGRHGDTPVVVTAAHVVSANNLSTVQIQDAHGNITDIQGGCYMYESNGIMADLSDKSLQAIDIAILRPAGLLEASPLSIAKTAPKRASWLEFVNTQLDGTPKYPSTYAGMVMTNQSNAQGIVALTGLGPRTRNASAAQYTVHGGASGGLVANMQNAQVEGIVYGATQGNDSTTTTSMSSQTLRNLFNVSFNAEAGSQTGIYPVEANIIGAPVLRQALASNRY